MDYSLNHHVLLLRNSKVVGETFHNVDILFLGTYYVEIATKLEDLIIDQGTEQDLEYVRSRSSTQGPYTKVFVIHSKGAKYYIGAGQIEIQENNLDISETSIGAKRSK